MKYQYEDNGYAVELSSSSGMSARFCSLERDEFLQVVNEVKDDYFDRDSPWDFDSLEDGIDHAIARYLGESCQYCEQITGKPVCDECAKIHGDVQ